jgi:hypothetical protein
MFYHPAVWWMSRRVRIERENCCDDLAVAVCGDPIQYARALTRLEELRDHALPVAVAANGGSLLDRIRRIAADRAESTGISSRWAAAAAMLVIVATIVALPSLPALAQREKTAASTPAATSVDVVEETNAGDEADHDTDADADADAGDLEAEEPPEMPVPVVVDADLSDLDLDLDVPPVAPVPMVAPVAPVARIAGVVPVAPRMPRMIVAPRALAAPQAMPAPPAAPAPAPTPAPPHAPAPPPTPAPRAHGFDFDFDFDFGDRVEDREIGAGGTFSVEELIVLRAAGVTAESLDAMRRIFPRLRLREAMNLGAVGVTPEFIRDMRAAGFAVENPREALILAATRVKPEWVREMRAAGVKIASAKDAAMLSAVGVDAGFVKRLAAAGYANLTARELARLAAAGVDEDYIRAMQRSHKEKDK